VLTEYLAFFWWNFILAWKVDLIECYLTRNLIIKIRFFILAWIIFTYYLAILTLCIIHMVGTLTISFNHILIWTLARFFIVIILWPLTWLVHKHNRQFPRAFVPPLLLFCAIRWAFNFLFKKVVIRNYIFIALLRYNFKLRLKLKGKSINYILNVIVNILWLLSILEMHGAFILKLVDWVWMAAKMYVCTYYRS
jgi:hypothetical protein